MEESKQKREMRVNKVRGRHEKERRENIPEEKPKGKENKKEIGCEWI